MRASFGGNDGWLTDLDELTPRHGSRPGLRDSSHGSPEAPLESSQLGALLEEIRTELRSLSVAQADVRRDIDSLHVPLTSVQRDIRMLLDKGGDSTGTAQMIGRTRTILTAVSADGNGAVLPNTPKDLPKALRRVRETEHGHHPHPSPHGANPHSKSLMRMQTIMNDHTICDKLALVRKGTTVAGEHHPGAPHEDRSHHSDGHCHCLPCYWILKPTSVQRLAFDLVNLIVVAYDLVTTPVALVFDGVLGNVYFVIGTWLTLLFWTVCLVMNFRAGFYNRNGDMVMRPQAVARRYLRTWLVPDVLTLFIDWLDVAFYFLAGGENSVFNGARLLRLPKVARLVRILRVLRMARFTDVLIRVSEQCLSSTVQSLVETGGFLFVLLWANHCLACAWVSLGWYGPTDTGLRWTDTLSGDKDITDFYLYSTALHWSMTQMTPGSMQVNAVNSAERWFTVFCLVLGLLFTGSIISSLSSKMTQLRMANQEKFQKLSTLRKFLLEKNITTEIALSIQKQVLTRMSDPKPLALADVPAVKLLSQSLRARLQEELCKPHILIYPFFRLTHQLDKTVIRSLCIQGMHLGFVPERDTLFSINTDAGSSFVLLHGKLTYRYAAHRDDNWESDTSQMEGTATGFTVQSGEEDSELEVLPGSWIAEPALWVRWHYRGTMEAATTSEVLRIEVSEVMKALHRHFVVAVMAEEYRVAFRSRLLHHYDGMGDVNDMHIPMASFHELVLHMTLESRMLIGLAAVEAIKQVWSWRIAAKDMAKLETDVRTGRCTLITTTDAAGNEQVEQIVVAVAIKVVEASGTTVLVQLGTIDEGCAMCNCALPNTPLEAGETPADAIERFVTSELVGLSGLLDLGAVEQRVELSDSEWYGIRTRRIETLFNATLKVPPAELMATHIAVKDCSQSQETHSAAGGPIGGLRKGVLGGLTGSMALTGGIPFRGLWAEETPREPSIQSSSVSQTAQSIHSGQTSTSLTEGAGRLPGQATPQRIPSPTPSMPTDLDVFALPTTSRKVPIFAWLSEADMEMYASPQGESSLRFLLNSLDIGMVELDQLRSSSV